MSKDYSKKVCMNCGIRWEDRFEMWSHCTVWGFSGRPKGHKWSRNPIYRPVISNHE